MCGKYANATSCWLAVPGSPPHVREIPFNVLINCCGFRITPACAGNTQTQQPKKSRARDHPRMCGKYVVVIVSNGTESGSPPHVREILR